MGDDYYGFYSVTVVNKGLEMVLLRIFYTFTSLDLSNNRLQGEVPEEIGDLKSLIVLNLSRNEFTSRIPSSLGNLSELESLDLSQNKLTGEIPPQLASLHFLSWLNLSYNNLRGSIPQGGQLSTFSNDSYRGKNMRLCGQPLLKKCKADDAILPPQTQDNNSEEDQEESLFDWKIVLMEYGCGLVIGFSVGYTILFTMNYNVWFVNRWVQVRNHGRRTNRRSRFFA